MLPREVNPEWVDKAKYAIERWFDMNQPVPTGAVRDALAAVLPEAMSEGWAKGYAASDYEAYHLGTHGRTDNPYEES